MTDEDLLANRIKNYAANLAVISAIFLGLALFDRSYLFVVLFLGAISFLIIYFKSLIASLASLLAGVFFLVVLIIMANSGEKVAMEIIAVLWWLWSSTMCAFYTFKQILKVSKSHKGGAKY